jgi:hypoxanthine phosphoribosyltransferase
MSTYYLPRELCDRYIEQLIRQIQASDIKFGVVVGIANGGLHVSRPIAEALNLPHKSVHISTYRDTPIIENVDFVDIYGEVLLVDDILDSGNTIALFKKHFKKDVYIATLYWKRGSPYEPNFYVQEKYDSWIKFYWEE